MDFLCEFCVALLKIFNQQAGPLHLCCQWGLEDVVQTLLEHGAFINAKVSSIIEQTRKLLKKTANLFSNLLVI